jgi:hypothetical protein
MLIRHILSSVACLDLQYFFPHYLINGKIFEKKKEKLLNTKCVCVLCFSVQGLSETFLIERGTGRYMIRYAPWSSFTVPVFLARF